MAPGRRPRKPKGGRVEAARRPAGGGLEEEILERYGRAGVELISDDVPRRLDPTLRSEMESITGAELGDVRIHTGERAHGMASALGARAFAAGQADVFFGPGEFAPGTAPGKALLAHELTHVAEGHTGLSRQVRRPEREDLELTARKAEDMVLAQEQAAEQTPPAKMAEPAQVLLPGQEGKADRAQGRAPFIDKAVLEDKIHDVIERELRRERERVGRT